ncbi:NAD-dependent epimerase/dehydratase family protein [Zoogloea dura]|uniref:NAD-dependent epimerase/dehydratase family protein n=1 Tax=Zoogloea dura TaxID=2728840 RepID=A0A848G1H4_9RHOO|nr:NAD-dependent epimerase/dehydratase family protein [Zoogloea dura]NML24989.1 NAD-dependent epimerase/dehydratase family protein [Zoogloea dura]
MFDPCHPVVREDIDAILQEALPWERLAGCHVYLTGGSGMLGGYLALVVAALQRKLADPPRLSLLARDPARLTARLGKALDPGLCEVIEGALEAPPPSRFGPPDVLIHAASPASPRNYATDPVGVIRANALGTLGLLDRFARERPVSFLMLGSAVYGSTENEGAVHEDSFGAVPTLDPRNCYIESKRMAETLLASWRAQYGLEFGIGRIFHTFGPGLNLDDGRIFSDVLRAARDGQPIVLTSDGSALRAFCYLADTVAGLFHILLKGDGASAYNVGNAGNEMSVRRFAELASQLRVPALPLLFGEADPKAYLAAKTSRGLPDTRRLEALGWRPRRGVAEALARTDQSLHP